MNLPQLSVETIQHDYVLNDSSDLEFWHGVLVFMSLDVKPYMIAIG
jgi:hypothetical protein